MLYASASSAQLVQNGDFDLPVQTVGTSNGWTAVGWVDEDHNGWRPDGGSPGAHFILNAGGQADSDPSVEQTLTGLTIGTMYVVSGMYCSRWYNAEPAGALSFRVDVGNSTIFAGEPTAFNHWTPFYAFFVATSPSAILKIRAETDGTDNDFAIDSIAVRTAVPQILDIGVPPDVAGGAAASGLSSDGTTIVGADGTTGIGVFRWTRATGSQDLGKPSGSVRAYAQGVNGDGSVVVGYTHTVSRGFLWTVDGGWHELSPLAGHRSSSTHCVSDDGQIAAGASFPFGSGRNAVKWRADGIITDLGGNTENSVSYGVNKDGSVIVGYSEPYAFRWTSQDGFQNLPMPEGWAVAAAQAVSGDGSKVVGFSSNASYSDSRGFLWNQSGGMRLLPRVQQGVSLQESATRVSADGSLIGGIFKTNEFGYRAAVWHPAFGGMPLGSYLARLGVDLDGWEFGFLAGISADGTSIAGSGWHNGNPRAWLVTGFFPANLCPADLNHDWIVEDADFVQFAAGYEILDCADPSMTLWCPADLDHDGFVDDSDFIEFVEAYSQLLCL